MERSSSSSSRSKGGKDKGSGGGAARGGGMPMPSSPYNNMGRPGMPYPPPGGFPYATPPMAGGQPDAQQQQLFQIQFRQQQLKLQQQMQQQQQQQQQQRRPSPPQAPPPPGPPQYSAQLQQSYTAASQQHQKQQQQQYPVNMPPPTQPNAAAVKAAAAATKKNLPKPPSPQEIRHLVAQCNWTDKTIYAARQLLGGTAINGFMRSTATAQRIKRQRARQVAIVRKNAKRAAGDMTEDPHLTEEQLKGEIMNPRTAKKIKTELEQGMQFVKSLHENIVSVMEELGSRNLPPPIERPIMAPTVVTHAASVTTPTTSFTNKSSSSTTTKKKTDNNDSISITPGDPQGSMLRKFRKRKPSMPQLNFVLPEHDAAGKRLFTKKEHAYRVSQILRFRALKAGDYVAARLSSHDLWILARIVKDYPATHVAPVDFLKLTPAKRDALFRKQVALNDAEDKKVTEPTMVARQLVLPLPRSYGEAAEWGTRLKKGTRVYAMYPNTSSLYKASVVDNTTYCRGEDDVIVVEFDEDEKDATGALPKWHIPARFVVLIPPEFPASQSTTTTTKKKRSSSTTPKNSNAKKGSKKAAAAAPAVANSTDPTSNGTSGGMPFDGMDFEPFVDFK